MGEVTSFAHFSLKKFGGNIWKPYLCSQNIINNERRLPYGREEKSVHPVIRNEEHSSNPARIGSWQPNIRLCYTSSFPPNAKRCTCPWWWRIHQLGWGVQLTQRWHSNHSRGRGRQHVATLHFQPITRRKPNSVVTFQFLSNSQICRIPSICRLRRSSLRLIRKRMIGRILCRLQSC